MSRAKNKQRSSKPSPRPQTAQTTAAPAAPPAPRSDWRATALACALPVLTIAVFVSLRTADFIRLDDPGYVKTNPHVNGGLTAAGFAWAWTSAGYASNWHPLTWLSHMLDVEMFGLWAGGHHLTNVVLHGLNTSLLFMVLYRTTTMLWRSLLVAALFAVHPMHVESVAWISERKDVLSTFFWFVTMFAYAAWAQRPALWRYLIVCVSLTAGLLSKPMLVTLPCVLILFDLWPLGRWNGSVRDLRPRIIEKLPLFALAAASSVLTFVAQREGGAVTGLDLLPLSTRLANAAVAYIRYLGKLVWPTDMAIFYPYREDLPGWLVVVSIVMVLALTAAAYRARRTHPYLTVGWLWFFGTLVPVIGIIQVGTQAIADRYTYVPYIGLFIVIAWAAADAWSRMRWPAIAGAAVATVIVGGLSAITVVQAQVWQTNTSLWRHAAAVTTGNYLALNEMGMVLAAENRHPEALEYFQQSSQHKPEYAEVRNNLGLTYVQLGRLPEALSQYETALRLKSAFPEAERNYAHALMSTGRLAEAETHYRRAIALTPDFPDTYNNLGVLLASQSRLDEAIKALQKAVRLSHSSTESQFLLGMAYGAANRLDEAEAAFRAVLRNDPNHTAARDGIARIEKMRSGKAGAGR